MARKPADGRWFWDCILRGAAGNQLPLPRASPKLSGLSETWGCCLSSREALGAGRKGFESWQVNQLFGAPALWSSCFPGRMLSNPGYCFHFRKQVLRRIKGFVQNLNYLAVAGIRARVTCIQSLFPAYSTQLPKTVPRQRAPSSTAPPSPPQSWLPPGRRAGQVGWP